jgi:hypothetical protein
MDLFTRKEQKNLTPEKIDLAKQNESKDYVTICQKTFNNKIAGKGLTIFTGDPNLSDLDRMVLPTIMVGFFSGQIPCNEVCPGYTPIPGDPIFFPNGDEVACQRYIPKEMLKDGWEAFREYVTNFKK